MVNQETPPAARARRLVPGPRPAAGKATALVIAVIMMGVLGAGADPVAPTEATEPGDVSSKAARALGRGHFEPNHGQFPDHVRFVVHGAGTDAFLTDEGATFTLREAPGPLDALPDPLETRLDGAAEAPPEPSLHTVHLRFEDADPGPMEGAEKKQGISNHFIGNDPDTWVTHVPHYGRVVQKGVWPGIDVEWHIAPEGLKFDAVVHPGADPNLVRFTLPGADAIALDAKGDLRIATPLGELVKEAPYTYQRAAGGMQEIPSHYVLDGGAVGFGIGDHDPSRALVIDPLIYATHLGGGNDGFAGTHAEGIAVDDEGHAYVTGWTASISATSGAHQTSNPGYQSVFVMKLTPAGDDVVFATYLGGSGRDHGMGVAVDHEGKVHVTGHTRSEDFPTRTTFEPTRPGTQQSAFYSKLNAEGTRLDNSTYLGGPGASGWTTAHGIAVDPEGHAYVTGYTSDATFPTTVGAAYPTHAGLVLAFVTKFELEDAQPAYSTFLGSPDASRNYGLAIAVDAEGSAYVTGGTNGEFFPTTAGAFQTSRAGSNYDAFVTKFTPEGNGLVYSTYLGGGGMDFGYGIAVDGDGHAYVTGITTSLRFPVTEGAFLDQHPTVTQPNRDRGSSAFLTKMNLDGTGLVYSTFIGGSGEEGHQEGLGPNTGGGYVETKTGAVAVDATGNAYVTGGTTSQDLADFGFIVNAYQAEHSGGTNIFVVSFPPDGSAPLWGTYLSGGRGMGIAVDPSGSAYVAGSAGAALPTTPGAYRQSGSGFAAKLYGVVADFDWSPDPPCPGEPVRFRDLSVSLSGRTGEEELPARSQWDLGDGSNPLIIDPWQNVATHTYFEEGNHNVMLTVADSFGASASVTRVVEVPWCPPPNHAPVLAKLPCIIASPEQRLSFQVRASVPVFPGDPSSYSNLSFFAEGLPSGATFQQDGDFAARFTWEVGPPDTYLFVVHVEDGGLPSHDVPSLRDSEEYCVEARPEKTAPPRSDASGDGVQNWHDACPHMKSPDQGDTAAGIEDPCDPAAPPEPEETPEEAAPPPDGCPARPVGPREVTARWTDGAVQVTWQSDSWCPPDHFLVWNGTGHHLVDFIVAEAGVHYVVLNTDPWPEPHQYFVQAMGADEGLFFDPTRAVASNLIDPAGCVAEGARSEACLPRGIDDEPPAGVEPAGPEVAAPADGAPVGLIAAALALAVAGLLALLWRLRHAPWVVHLFTRLGPQDILEHPVRKEIMALVTGEPGIHYREILRRTGKSHGTAQHHLKVLLAANMVLERKSGQYICYWPTRGPKGGPAEGLLHSAVARRLLRHLLDEPGLSVADLAGRLGANAATVRYHLRRLEKGGLARLERHGPRAKVYPSKFSKGALDFAAE